MSEFIVRYGGMRFLGVFKANGSDPYQRGVDVIVRTDRGLEVGQVLCPTSEQALEWLKDPVEGQILRQMTPEDHLEVRRIADKLKPRGPCNVQLRMSSKGPVCFEINVRFSGTTPMRTYYGFNEVEAALRHFVLNEPLADFPIIREGVVVRYWNELYLAPEAVHNLEREGQLHEPMQFGPFFENFWRKK